jgi:hypothetical protein
MDGLFHSHSWTADMNTDPPEQLGELPQLANKACVTDHSIYLLYPFRIGEHKLARGKNNQDSRSKKSVDEERLRTRPSGRVSDLVEASWQPKMTEVLRQKAEEIKRSVEAKNAEQQLTEKAVGDKPEMQLADDNVWQESIWNVARDMEPQVARLLSQGLAGGGKGRDKGDELVRRGQIKSDHDRLSKDKSEQQSDSVGEAVRVWVLKRENNIRNAVSGRIGLARFLAPQLAVKFSPAACKRLAARLGEEAPSNMVIEIGEVKALTFPTGQGLLVTEIKIRPDGGRTRPIALSLLVEAVVAVCNDRHLTWLGRDRLRGAKDETVGKLSAPAAETAKDRSGNAEDQARQPERRTGVGADRLKFDLRGDQKELKLGDVFTTLLGDYAKNGITGSRIFSYVFAKLDQGLDAAERQRLMFQLAGKYTDDYRIDPTAYDERIYQPFESISHLAALEGAATLVENPPFEDRTRADFLENYGSNAIERRYLPVVVLAYHAFLTLLHLLQDSRSWINLRAPSRQEADDLRELRDRALEFRLFHRLSYVSLLTMPNEFYHRLASAFGLERMLASADRDVRELSALLDARVKEAEAIRSRWFRLLTATSLAVIAGATLGKIVVEAVPVAWINGLITGIHAHAEEVISIAYKMRIDRGDVGHFVELVFSVVFGGFALWWSEGAEIEKGTKDELAAHTGLEWHQP